MDVHSWRFWLWGSWNLKDHHVPTSHHWKKMITKLLICIKKPWPKHKSMNAKITSLSNLKMVTQSYVARWSEEERMSHFNLFSRQILLYDTNNLSWSNWQLASVKVVNCIDYLSDEWSNQCPTCLRANRSHRWMDWYLYLVADALHETVAGSHRAGSFRQRNTFMWHFVEKVGTFLFQMVQTVNKHSSSRRGLLSPSAAALTLTNLGWFDQSRRFPRILYQSEDK